MQTIDIQRHAIGSGGVVMTSRETGAQWYAVPEDNDGCPHRFVEAMVREARRAPDPTPTWWTALHDRALAVLSGEWQPARDLMRMADVSFVALDDLVVAGVAEVRRDPLVSASGHPAGEGTLFRAVTP